MKTTNSRMSKEHYLLAKRILQFLKRRTEFMPTAQMRDVIGGDAYSLKKVLRVLRKRRLVVMRGGSRWAAYTVSEACRRRMTKLPFRIKVAPRKPIGGLWEF